MFQSGFISRADIKAPQWQHSRKLLVGIMMWIMPAFPGRTPDARAARPLTIEADPFACLELSFELSTGVLVLDSETIGAKFVMFAKCLWELDTFLSMSPHI